MEFLLIHIDFAHFVLVKLVPESPILRIGAILTMAGMVLLSIITTAFRKVFGKESIKSLLYAIVCSLLFAIAALFADKKIFNLSLQQSFYAIQAYMLLLGIIHVNIMPHLFKWMQKKSFWPQLLFTIAIALMGVSPFVFSFNYFAPDIYNQYLLGGFIAFILPTLFMKTFESAINIPVKARKKWIFPVSEEFKVPHDELIKNVHVMGFEFTKHINDSEITNFKVKAPKRMEFEKLFYFFVHEYNLKHPESQIDIVDRKGIPYEWIFYKKPKWYSISNRFVDPELTMEENKIKENTIVICERT